MGILKLNQGHLARRKIIGVNLLNKKLSIKKKILISFLIILVIGFLIPEKLIIPIKGASSSDWNHNTFWYEPWGKSGVHKGIDIFGTKGQELISSSKGIVVYTGKFALGGNVVVVLGPKWRFHYYAHLDSISTDSFSLVSAGEKIGLVGDTGNAKGKPPHLHYSIVTPFPYFWRADLSTQGWKKMFFLNPGGKLIGDF